MAKLTRGERFKDARIVHNQHKKQTMDKVSADTGVSKSLIQSLEDDSANRSVGYDKVAELAKHYGVTTDYLLCLTDDPQRQPAATDDLGLSAKAVNTLRILQRGGEPGHDCLNFFNLILESSLFSHFLYSLFVDVQAHIAEAVYMYDYKLDSCSHQNEITRIATSGKYNSYISTYLQQMVRFDREQNDLVDSHDSIRLDCGFSASDVIHLTRERTNEAYLALLRDICDASARPVLKNLSQEDKSATTEKGPSRDKSANQT
jgi:transcriptional regulator with XRE-family HTH domain